MSFSKYIEIAKVSWRESRLAYLGNVIVRSTTVAIRLWTFLQLYQAAFRSQGVSSIGTLSLSMTIWVLMMTQTFQAMKRPGTHTLVEDEVKSVTKVGGMD